MEGMKNQLLRLFLSFRKMGGEEGGRGIYKLYHPSIHCFLQYLYHWRDMDSGRRKDAIPEIKLQYIVYFTATSEAEINFPFLLRKRIPDSLREGKKRCVKWYAKSSQKALTIMIRDKPHFPGRKKAAESVASPLLWLLPQNRCSKEVQSHDTNQNRQVQTVWQLEKAGGNATSICVQQPQYVNPFVLIIT